MIHYLSRSISEVVVTIWKMQFVHGVNEARQRGKLQTQDRCSALTRYLLPDEDLLHLWLLTGNSAVSLDQASV